MLFVLVQRTELAHQLAAIVTHVAKHLVVYVTDEVAGWLFLWISRAATDG